MYASIARNLLPWIFALIVAFGTGRVVVETVRVAQDVRSQALPYEHYSGYLRWLVGKSILPVILIITFGIFLIILIQS